jgi:protein-S-isoprenylcysteine O-methyltransferase Ste14
MVEAFYRHRGWIAAIPLLALLAQRAVSGSPLRWGVLPLIAAAMLLRAWAARHLGPHGNGSGMEAPALARTGPYAFSRHPLYLANIATGVGLVLFANPPAPFSLALIALIALQYFALARLEENALRWRYPDAYEDYAQRTPRWFGLKPPPGEGVASEENGSRFARDENHPNETPQMRNLLYTVGCVLLVWGAERLSRLW